MGRFIGCLFGENIWGLHIESGGVIPSSSSLDLKELFNLRGCGILMCDDDGQVMGYLCG